MDDKRYNYYKDIIRALSYTRMRALRAFCSLEEIYAHEVIDSLERLVFTPLSFEQVLFFETFAPLDGATVVKSWQLLELTAELDFTTMQTVAAIGGIEAINADMLIELVRQVKALDDQGRWAAKALFGVDGIDREAVAQGLRLLGIMTAQQRLSAEQSFLIKDMDIQTMMKVLPQIAALSGPDSINSRGLFSLETTTPGQALFWLQSYFNLPKTQEDQKF